MDKDTVKISFRNLNAVKNATNIIEIHWKGDDDCDNYSVGRINDLGNVIEIPSYVKDYSNIYIRANNKTIDTIDVFKSIGIINTESFDLSKSTSYPQCITNVIVPDGVTDISSYAFSNMENVTNISLPASTKTINDYAFMQAGIKTISIPKNVNNISKRAFSDCSLLTSISVSSENVYYSGSNGVLYDYNKEKLLTVPNGMTEIISYPDSIKSIEAFAFDGCKSELIENLSIPETVTKIHEDAFGNKDSTKGVIGDDWLYGDDDYYYRAIPYTVNFYKEHTPNQEDYELVYTINRKGIANREPDLTYDGDTLGFTINSNKTQSTGKIVENGENTFNVYYDYTDGKPYVIVHRFQNEIDGTDYTDVYLSDDDYKNYFKGNVPSGTVNDDTEAQTFDLTNVSEYPGIDKYKRISVVNTKISADGEDRAEITYDLIKVQYKVVADMPDGADDFDLTDTLYGEVGEEITVDPDEYGDKVPASYKVDEDNFTTEVGTVTLSKPKNEDDVLIIRIPYKLATADFTVNCYLETSPRTGIYDTTNEEYTHTYTFNGNIGDTITKDYLESLLSEESWFSEYALVTTGENAFGETTISANGDTTVNAYFSYSSFYPFIGEDDINPDDI